MYVISVIYARLELRPKRKISTKLHTKITISILEMSTRTFRS